MSSPTPREILIARQRARKKPDRVTMNLRRFLAYRPHWDWKGMMGSAACLKWSFRDLESLDAALAFVPGRTCVIQAGGNIGIFPKRLAEEFRSVITFEPDDGLFRQLQLNAPEKNILAFRSALGPDRTPVRMACKRRDDSGRAVHEGLTHVAGPGEIPQVLIDDLSVPVCDLIYLDIEGYELNALRGAAATIARCRPVIGVEINRNIQHYGADGDALRKYIEDFGYRRVLASHSDEIFVPEAR